jgi:D-inositol-3-phosphate glycosyltransferase
MAVELGIKSLVTFTGEVSRREVFAFLGLVDGIIFTSTVDTQGLAVLEGMAMRLPVVTAESPAARELVRDGQEGLVCPADPVALAAAVRTLANDPALADRMGQAALERSRAFHPTLLAVRLAAIYAGLCSRVGQAGQAVTRPEDGTTGRD